MSATVSIGIGRRVDRALAWFHRWVGIVLGLLFVAWFASGAVLLYVPFPALSEQDRLAHSEPIDGSKLTVTPEAALAASRGTEQLALVSVAGEPVYLAFDAGGKAVAVAGDRGIPLTFSARVARTVAERFAKSSVLSVTGPLEYDQWIVHQRFDPFRPFFRARLAGPAETDLYVSARTGQVLQATTGRQRAWNWCGAVLHWLYFTPLRKSWTAWNQVVWWLSLLALLANLAGTWLGIDRTVRTRAHNRTRWSPFRGWMRWHHVIGLFASAVILIWMLSGWLSMDHGRLFSRGQPSAHAVSLVRGMSLEAVTRAVPASFKEALPGAAEVRFNAIAGQPFAAAQGGALTHPRVTWLNPPATVPTDSIPTSILQAGLRAAWASPAQVEPIPASGHDFYAIAESLDSNAQAFDIKEHDTLRVYVHKVTGDLLVVMDPSRRAYAWVYYALHTFNFPALLGRPVSREIIILLQLMVGLTFVATGIVVGYRRLGKSFAR